MFFFGKKKVVKELRDAAWGCLVKQGVDVDTISRHLRCVEKEGVIDGKGRGSFLRVFKPMEADAKGIEVTGWETFDHHPDLVIFEGYITEANTAHFDRKRELHIAS